MAAVFGGAALPWAGRLDPAALMNAAVIGGHEARQTAAQILADHLEKQRPDLFSGLSEDLRTVRNGIHDAEGTQVRYGRNDWKNSFVNKWNWMPKEWEEAGQRLLSGRPMGDVPPVPGHSPSEIGAYANDIRAEYSKNGGRINAAGAPLGVPHVSETARELHPQLSGNEIYDFGNAWLNRHPGTGVTPMGYEIVPGSVDKAAAEAARAIKSYFESNLVMGKNGPEWVNGEAFKTDYLDDPELSKKFKELRTQDDLDAWIDKESKRVAHVAASGEDRMHPVNEATITDEYRRKYPYMGPGIHSASVKQWADYLARMDDRASMLEKHSPEMDRAIDRIRKILKEHQKDGSLDQNASANLKAMLGLVGEEPKTNGAYPVATIAGDVQTQRGIRGQDAMGETAAYFNNILKQTAPIGYFASLSTNPGSAIIDPVQQGMATFATLGPKAALQGGISRLQRSPVVSRLFGKEVSLDPTKTFSRPIQPFSTSNEIAGPVAADVAIKDLHRVLTDPKAADYRDFMYSPDEQIKLLSAYDKNGNLDLNKAGDLPWRHVGNVLAAVNGTETASSGPALFRGPWGSALGSFLKTPTGIASSIYNSAGKYGFGNKSFGWQARYAMAPLLQALAVRGAKASPYLSSGLLAMSAAGPLKGLTGLGPAALELYNSREPTDAQEKARQDLETIKNLGEQAAGGDLGAAGRLVATGAAEAFPSRSFQPSDLIQGARTGLDKSAMGAQTPLPNQSPVDLSLSQILPGLYGPFSMLGQFAALPRKYGSFGEGAKAAVTNGVSPFPFLKQLSPRPFSVMPTYTNQDINTNGVMEDYPNLIQIQKNSTKIRVPRKK